MIPAKVAAVSQKDADAERGRGKEKSTWRKRVAGSESEREKPECQDRKRESRDEFGRWAVAAERWAVRAGFAGPGCISKRSRLYPNVVGARMAERVANGLTEDVSKMVEHNGRLKHVESRPLT